MGRPFGIHRERGVGENPAWDLSRRQASPKDTVMHLVGFRNGDEYKAMTSAAGACIGFVPAPVLGSSAGSAGVNGGSSRRARLDLSWRRPAAPVRSPSRSPRIAVHEEVLAESTSPER